MELTELSGGLCCIYDDDHGWTKNRGKFSQYEYAYGDKENIYEVSTIENLARMVTGLLDYHYSKL